MSLKIKTTPEIASKLKDAKTFEARLFQPPHSQAEVVAEIRTSC